VRVILDLGSSQKRSQYSGHGTPPPKISPILRGMVEASHQLASCQHGQAMVMRSVSVWATVPGGKLGGRGHWLLSLEFPGSGGAAHTSGSSQEKQRRRVAAKRDRLVQCGFYRLALASSLLRAGNELCQPIGLCRDEASHCTTELTCLIGQQLRVNPVAANIPSILHPAKRGPLLPS
jgi:hypothetical protein